MMKMKLKLPGDITGGLMIFGIMFAVAIIELYLLKNVKAFRASETPAQFVCNSLGGDWHPNEDTDDPCCLLPKGANSAGVPECEGNLTSQSYCPEVCKNEPGSAFCKGMCTGMKV